MKLSKHTWLGEVTCHETLDIEVPELVDLLKQGVLTFDTMLEVLGCEPKPQDAIARFRENFEKKQGING